VRRCAHAEIAIVAVKCTAFANCTVVAIKRLTLDALVRFAVFAHGLSAVVTLAIRHVAPLAKRLVTVTPMNTHVAQVVIAAGACILG
jgi:hypothetical protein